MDGATRPKCIIPRNFLYISFTMAAITKYTAYIISGAKTLTV